MKTMMLTYKPYPEIDPHRIEVMLDGTRLGTIYAPPGEHINDDRRVEWFSRGAKTARPFPTLMDAKKYIESLVATR